MSCLVCILFNKTLYNGMVLGMFLKEQIYIFLSIFLMMMASTAVKAQETENDVVQPAPYILGPGDVIDIVVYQEPDLSFQVRLGESGLVSYPFIGEVIVKGKTTSEVEQDIKERLVSGEFLVRPEIIINIIAFRPFFIDGAVARPGSYPFEPGLTLRQAVSIAGGFTERASRSNISIIRDDEEVNLLDKVLDTPIRSGDIVTVDNRFF